MLANFHEYQKYKRECMKFSVSRMKVFLNYLKKFNVRDSQFYRVRSEGFAGVVMPAQSPRKFRYHIKKKKSEGFDFGGACQSKSPQE